MGKNETFSVQFKLTGMPNVVADEYISEVSSKLLHNSVMNIKMILIMCFGQCSIILECSILLLTFSPLLFILLLKKVN